MTNWLTGPLLIGILASEFSSAYACTNVLVTPGASENGDSMIAYNADSGNLMGMLYHYPASSSMSYENLPSRKVWNWDTGVYLGEIPEAEETFNVVGNTNEYGLVIAETTFGGIEILANPKNQPDAVIDYGSLIYITLQRSKNAKEAIKTMVDLIDTYGYASEGESFSIADKHGEVWMMEVIGRGKGKVGAVWVAMKIPDGMIAGHSNQARITTFPRNDSENCLYSHDVVSLAKEIGIYQSAPDDPDDLKFSFSDIYDPITFMGARASEARTWSIFSSLAEDDSFQSKYEYYAMGKEPNNRMPLWIKPKQKLSLNDIRFVMSNHYEGTVLASNNDVGAGLYDAPYRPRPLHWSYGGESYHNERSVATQQTGWNFIAQIRANMPAPISSVLWFAVDDSSTSPRFPVYGGSTAISNAYSGKGTQDGVPSPVLSFDMTKAFWIQNMVSNLAYSRWSDAYPLLVKQLQAVHDSFQYELDILDQKLLALHKQGKKISLLEEATDFGIAMGDKLHKEWMDFYGKLFARLRDFYVIEEDPMDPICNCKVKEEGFSNFWKQRIVEETGTKYKCEDQNAVPDMFMFPQMKLRGSTHDDKTNRMESISSRA